MQSFVPDSLTTPVPRRLRFCLWVFRVARWLVPARRCFAFPVAVRRKRFFVPLCVFILGMIDYLSCTESYSVASLPWVDLKQRPVIVNPIGRHEKGDLQGEKMERKIPPGPFSAEPAVKLLVSRQNDHDTLRLAAIPFARSPP